MKSDHNDAHGKQHGHGARVPESGRSTAAALGAVAAIGALAVGGAIAKHRLAQTDMTAVSENATPTVAPLAAPARSPVPRASAPVDQLVGPLVERLARAPDDPSSWVLLGKSYDYLGRPREAAEAYRAAIAHGSTDPAVASAMKAAEDKFVLAAIGGAGHD